MCDQGRLDFHFVNSERRLTDPMAKHAGIHRVVRWDEAILTVASRLSDVEKGEIAIVASARMTNEELYLVRGLAKALGTDKVATVARTGGGDNYLRSDDLNPNTLGAKLILGGDTFEEIEGDSKRGARWKDQSGDRAGRRFAQSRLRG